VNLALRSLAGHTLTTEERTVNPSGGSAALARIAEVIGIPLDEASLRP
jgi:hypothetical protein